MEEEAVWLSELCLLIGGLTNMDVKAPLGGLSYDAGACWIRQMRARDLPNSLTGHEGLDLWAGVNVWCRGAVVWISS